MVVNQPHQTEKKTKKIEWKDFAQDKTITA